jgi:hypothetical protein
VHLQRQLRGISLTQTDVHIRATNARSPEERLDTARKDIKRPEEMLKPIKALQARMYRTAQELEDAKRAPKPTFGETRIASSFKAPAPSTPVKPPSRPRPKPLLSGTRWAHSRVVVSPARTPVKRTIVANKTKENQREGVSITPLLKVVGDNRPQQWLIECIC